MIPGIAPVICRMASGPGSIADHYGTTGGKIPIHWDMVAGRTASGGLITAVENYGGSGATYDLAPISGGTNNIEISSSGARWTWKGGIGLQCGTDINIRDTHYLIAVNSAGPGGGGTAGLLFKAGVSLRYRFHTNSLRLFLSIGLPDYAPTKQINNIGLASTDGIWVLAEVRFNADEVSYYLNGVRQGTYSFSDADIGMNTLGGRETDVALVGTIRAAALVKCSGGSKDSPEDAVLAARSELGALIGLTL